LLRVLLVSFTNIYKSDIMNPSEYIVRFRSRADRLDLIRFAPHGLSFKADLKHYSSEGSAWRITKASAGVNSLQFDCCSPPYQDVVFTVTLQRLSAFDAKIAIGPATAVWLLVLATFCMRPQCPERIHVGCLAILLVTVMLIYFRLTLPSSGGGTPLVGISTPYLAWLGFSDLTRCCGCGSIPTGIKILFQSFFKFFHRHYQILAFQVSDSLFFFFFSLSVWLKWKTC